MKFNKYLLMFCVRAVFSSRPLVKKNGGFENLNHRKREPQPPETRTLVTGWLYYRVKNRGVFLSVTEVLEGIGL
jgi:hypothetical protein